MEEKQEQEQSEQINEIAAALAKAQGAFKPVHKNCSNSFFKSANGKPSTYADLSSISAATKEALAMNGLSVTQRPRKSASSVKVTSLLLHASGQWLSASSEITFEKSTAHGIGSATSYGRRYSISALLGIATEDEDDGNEATQVQPIPAAQPVQRVFFHAEPPSQVQAPVVATQAPQAPKEQTKGKQQRAPNVVPFGRNEGKFISDKTVELSDLTYLENYYLKQISDPKKAHFTTDNKVALLAIQTEILQRNS